jgi:hypothetical protein
VKHVLGRCIFLLAAADAADEADPIKKIKKYHSVPGVTEGNLRLRLAYGLLTPSLRQFPISDSDSVNFDLIFKQYREESSIRSGLLSLYMQWHNGIINHRHSIACNSMHQMKHTTLFEPQVSWPDMDLRTAYGNMFVTNAYVKPFALLTKPKESLTT